MTIASEENETNKFNIPEYFKCCGDYASVS